MEALRATFAQVVQGARMAVTSGHGNPHWTQDETILALELYQLCEGKIPSEEDARVVALSDLLRTLSLYPDNQKQKTFRNPAGVAFKLQNLHSVRTGRGLSNTSKTDRQVWTDFGGRPDVVAVLAADIRTKAPTLTAAFAGEDESPEVFPEGRIATYLHKRRERDPKLRKKLLKQRAKEGPLECDACGTKANVDDEALADAIFEAHHIVPLHRGEVKTSLADLALLCASCHRLIHRAMVVQKLNLGVAEMKKLFRRG